MTDYYPFDGDGRKKVFWHDYGRPPGTEPMDLTLGQIRSAIDALIATEHSTHSGQGATLWPLLAWLAANDKAYTLTRFMHGAGWHLSLHRG